MRKVLRKLFNLYPGEGRSASLFLILGFFWSLGAFGALTLSEGMFLEHVGAKGLPTSYLLTAAFLCLLSSVLLFSLQRLSISHLLALVISGVTVALLCLYFCMPSSSHTLWYLFKIVGYSAPVAIYICFWAFIDQYYDLQDAKRCFCLFNSILYLGDACGGGLISFFLEKIGTGGLLLLFVASLLSSLPLIYLIVKRRKTVPEECIDGNPPQGNLSLKPLLKRVLSSPFTIVLMLFYFLMQLIAITTEYTYMDSFEKAFAATQKSHVLTEFLGKLAMWVSLGNMFFGLFFYSRTVTRIGVNNMILIAPLFFLMIFFSWSWQETLALALLALIAREGMSYTFDDNNLLLLISGVPTNVKNQVRIAIESFFEPVGMLCGATLLFLLQSQSKLLGLALSFLALIVVFLLRSHYAKAIFDNLIAHSIRFEKKASEWIKGLSKKDLKKWEIDLQTGLKKNDEEIQLLSFEYLLKMENPALLPRLLNQAGRFSIRGKLRAIELLSESTFSHETIVIDRLEQWRRMLPHPTVRGSIHFYFASCRLARSDQMIAHIDSDQLPLQAAAILTLKTFPEKISHSLTALEKLKKLLHSKDENELCTGLNILRLEKRADNLKELLPFLKHPSQSVAQTAARAISECAGRDASAFVPELVTAIGRTNNAKVRKFILVALEKIGSQEMIEDLILSCVHFQRHERKQIESMVQGFGKEPTSLVLSMVQDETLHVKCRLLAGKILGKLSLPDLRALLRKLIESEMERASLYFSSAKTLKQERDSDLAILENALTTSYKATFDFVIQLIAIAHGLDECEVLAAAIHSKNRKTRAHAIETLEKSADPALFTLIKPFLDERQSSGTYRKEQLSLNELLDLLEESPSVANRIVSRTLKGRQEIFA